MQEHRSSHQQNKTMKNKLQVKHELRSALGCTVNKEEMVGRLPEWKVLQFFFFPKMFPFLTQLYTERTKVDEKVFGGNKSAEAPDDDDTEESAVSGCDIVLQNRLVEQVGVDKKGYQKYIKLYTAAVLNHLKEKRPDDAEKFKANAPKAVKRILSSIDDWQFFHGESDFDFDNKEKADGMLAIMGYRSDGRTPYMLFFKDGLYEEKAVRQHVLVTVYTSCW